MLPGLCGIFPLHEMLSSHYTFLEISYLTFKTWLNIASSTPSGSDLIGLGCGLSFGTFKCYSGDTNMHQSLRVAARGQWLLNLSKHQNQLQGLLKHILQGLPPKFRIQF